MYATVLSSLSVTNAKRLVGWNRDYQNLASNFTSNLMKAALILSVIPKPLKP